MEEVLETLELAERQKIADEQEIETLRRGLRQLHRPERRRAASAAALSPALKSTPISEALIAAARRLRAETSRLKFKPPVTHVYNPLVYAWAPYEAYLQKFGATRKRVVLLGMNPGPFGMVQTGVPFGEVAAVRDWLKIECPVGKPAREHPRRPVTGFACARSEVSGRRLWGLFAERFGTPEQFFAAAYRDELLPAGLSGKQRPQSHAGQAARI